ncbi:MAG: 23S rRNA (uracil(1939)-C(5))-methyltransferase RlmD, partial [Oscillospiraceae bacterium]
MMIEKNKSYVGTIEDLTLDGNGICKMDGFAVFIPATAVGDVVRFKAVKVQKNYGYGVLEEIVEPSSARCEVDCPVFQQCGGCCFRHIEYKEELRLKEKAIKDAFQRIGGFSSEPDSIMGTDIPDYYRNKAQYPLGVNENGEAVAGFYAKRSHRLIASDHCKIQDERFTPIVQWVLDFVNRYHLSVYNEKTGQGLLRHIFLRVGRSSGEVMLCLVATEKKLPFREEFVAELLTKFPAIKSVLINLNKSKTNVILGTKFFPIFGEDHINDTLLDTQFSIAPLAFYQVNKEQAERLYTLAYQYAEFDGSELLIDLYCGIGAIGLAAYPHVNRLIGVESVAPAIESAQYNAILNHAENAEFICTDAKTAARELVSQGVQPDVVIVDPPRQGCDRDVLESIIRMAPKKVIMISCDPATAARDCQILSEKGFFLAKYQGVDMFPRTG